MFHAETYEQLSIISLDKSIMAFAKHIGLPDDGAPASPYSSKDPRARVKMQEQQVKGVVTEFELVNYLKEGRGSTKIAGIFKWYYPKIMKHF